MVAAGNRIRTVGGIGIRGDCRERGNRCAEAHSPTSLKYLSKTVCFVRTIVEPVPGTHVWKTQPQYLKTSLELFNRRKCQTIDVGVYTARVEPTSIKNKGATRPNFIKSGRQSGRSSDLNATTAGNGDYSSKTRQQHCVGLRFRYGREESANFAGRERAGMNIRVSIPSIQPRHQCVECTAGRTAVRRNECRVVTGCRRHVKRMIIGPGRYI